MITLRVDDKVFQAEIDRFSPAINAKLQGKKWDFDK